MKIKTNELSGIALDWAVAKCEGLDAYLRSSGLYARGFKHQNPHVVPKIAYSTDWAQGGPIIDKEMLCIGYQHQADPNYCPMNDPATICWARTTAGGYLSYGPTPLIAAMRCYVASKFGDEVAVPDELLS